MIFIVGPTASGKDAIGNILEKNGYSGVMSYTTRKPRSNDDFSHYFIGKNDISSYRDRWVCHTTIAGEHYFVTDDELEDNDFYIVDPAGLMDALKYYKDRRDERCIIFNVLRPRLTRRRGWLERNPMATIEEFNERCESEDPQFKIFYSICDTDWFIREWGVNHYVINNTGSMETLESKVMRLIKNAKIKPKAR